MLFSGTRFVAAHRRASLDVFVDELDLLLAPAAARRRDAVGEHALFAVAAFLDERGVPRLRSWLRSPASPTSAVAVSVGSHEQSDVGPIDGASLRHALVVIDPAFRPVIDVIDLQTPQGLEADGLSHVQRLQSLFVQRFRVGTGDVIVAHLMPGHLVEHALEEIRDSLVLGAMSARLKNDVRAHSRPMAPCEVSAVKKEVQKGRAPPGPRSSGQTTARSITRVMGEVLREGTMQVSPTDQELRNGFLIGRYERCSYQSRDALMSRVHAFIIERGDQLLVADVGSTNGTFVQVDGVMHELSRRNRVVVAPATAKIRCGSTNIEIRAA